jgi:lipopolysaccharide transport system permease protein
MHQPDVIIIEAGKPKRFFDFKELLRYKDLLYYMVLRDVTVLYKQTILGFAWAIINPLFQIIVFSVIFGYFMQLQTKADIGNMPYPVFSCLAVIPWTYFSASLNSSATTLINASSILTKVYIPRLIFPLVPVLSKLIDFFISFIILIALTIFFKYQLTVNVILIILPLILLIITSAGLGFWFSALAVQYRDFKFALSFTLPLLMYIAPVAFPATLVLNKLGSTVYHIYAVYPMVGVIEGFRGSFSTHFPWLLFVISSLSAIIIFISGLWYFKRMEKYFADVV